MRSQFNRIPGDLDRRIQRAVVLQVLRDDHHQRWTRAELESELSDVEPDAVNRAVASLATLGVIRVERDVVFASLAARRLDELELIGV